MQHAWATAVEVIGFVTESQPKFEKGDKRYQTAMAFASEILSRAHEQRTGSLSDISDHELVKKFQSLEQELNLLQRLSSLSSANKEVTKKRNAILIIGQSGELEIRTYGDATDALRTLFELEEQYPDQDIVLVRGDTSDDVRIAFRNYFSDTNDFISLVNSGCLKLTSVDSES